MVESTPEFLPGRCPSPPRASSFNTSSNCACISPTSVEDDQWWPRGYALELDLYEVTGLEPALSRDSISVLPYPYAEWLRSFHLCYHSNHEIPGAIHVNPVHVLEL